MVEIKDTNLLEKYMKKYNINDIFDTPNLPFKLYRYETGEFMNISHPQEDYIKFLVEGTVASDEVDINGNIKRLYEESAFAFSGEVELAGYSFSNHYHEVIDTVYSIELPLKQYRDTLLNDKCFLQYLVKRMSYTIYEATHQLSYLNYNVNERVIYYLKYVSPTHTLSGMESTAKRLQCSRRQLQRAVNQLIDDNIIVKTGWGTYSLTNTLPNT